MASGPARTALIGAWLVVIAGVAGGAAYVDSLGPPAGLPVLSTPEAAPEPQSPTRLDASELDVAPTEPAVPDVHEDQAATSEPAPDHDGSDAGNDAEVAAPDAEQLPQLEQPAEATGATDGQQPIDLASESLETLGGGDAGADTATDTADQADSIPMLADLTRQAEAGATPEHFEPQTAWPVETPSLHGPMPMPPRQTVDLAALGDAPGTAAQEVAPPVLAPPPATPETTAHDSPAVPAAPDVADHPAEAPAAIEQDDHPAAPPPASHETMADEGHDATAEPAVETMVASNEPPGHVPEMAEPEVHETPPATASTAEAAEPPEATAAAEADGLSTEPDERVVEVADIGPLPVVGPTGARPADVYARPFDAPGNRPVIAVVVGGLGLSSAATEAAIQSLPAAVTLSFSPYSGRLQDWVALARAAGHEVLIDLPMEPVDFPHSDPGPQALMTSLTPEDNMHRLEWVLSRATNYIGVGSYMGSRFAADAAAMRPVLQAINARGLIYLDNGQAIGNVAPTLSAEIGLPVLVSDLKVDQMAARQVIDDSLSQIESKAQREGAALAIGTAYPVTIERLSVWTRSLADRGFALAPASALVAR